MFVCSVSRGVGVRWQKPVHEYRGLGRVSDMFGHVAVQVSSCSLDHSKKNGALESKFSVKALKPSVRHARQLG